METSQQNIELAEQKRSKWLIINLIGFFIWDGLRIIDSYILINQPKQIITGAILLGATIWIVSLIQLMKFGKSIKNNRQVMQILNDELMELNRLKTWRFALLSLVLTQVVIIGFSLLSNSITGLLAAELSIFVTVLSSIGGFLYFNSEQNA